MVGMEMLSVSDNVLSAFLTKAKGVLLFITL